MIELAGIRRAYHVGNQDVYALSDVDLTIERGDYVSIMGPSGSGKSTLLNIIGLLDRPDQGAYRLDEQDVTTLTDDQQAGVRQRTMGFVFQFFHLIPRLSAADNIALPLVLAGVPADERRTRVDAVLADMGLSDRAEHRPEELSGGQRQRVAIARAVIMRPSILLADEPTGNLDRHTGEEVVTLLEGLHASGLTLLVVTHDPALGHRAGRQLRMEDGRIISDTQSQPAP
ncbi:MAG: ATP-binding cassette domain-containing protein [Gammaproteobacteria bacterium]|nr:ATP-binding cassette domain-containing protein [Gammaproteobacteria bacterium]